MKSSARIKKYPKLLCDDNWIWDKNHHSHEVILSRDFMTAYFHPTWSSGTAAVRGTRILNHQRFYWELKLAHKIFGTSMMFGIGTCKARLHEDSFVNLLGTDDQSWGLSHKGIIWHNGEGFYYTKPFRENVPTIVGILFDGISGTLTFFKDGKSLGIAFRGLEMIDEPLYPIVCSTAAKTEIILQRTKRDFFNLQDHCRTVIVKQIKNKCDLTKLGLPISMQIYLAEIYVDNNNLKNNDSYKIISENLNYLESNFLTSIPSK